MTELTQEYLKSILHYDPETGVFTWLIKKGKVFPGDVAGGLDISKGYWRIMIDGKGYKGHRLAYFYETGKWPVVEIDHKDTNRSNNRFNNLREATRSQTRMNSRGMISDEAKGTTYNKKLKAWVARVKVDGVYRHWSSHKTQEEAHKAYVKAAIELHGDYCYFSTEKE